MPRPAPTMPVKGTRPERLLEDALRRVLPSALLEAGQFERQPRDIPGDFVWRHRAVSVFVDGCQWHLCPAHFRPHTTGGLVEHGLTAEGAARQRQRDSVLRRALAANGARVLCFWEHDIKADADKCARKVAEALKR